MSGFCQVVDCRVNLPIFMFKAILLLYNKATNLSLVMRAWARAPELKFPQKWSMTWSFSNEDEGEQNGIPFLIYATRLRTGRWQTADRLKNSAAMMAARVRHPALDIHLLPRSGFKHSILSVLIYFLWNGWTNQVMHIYETWSVRGWERQVCRYFLIGQEIRNFC